MKYRMVLVLAAAVFALSGCGKSEQPSSRVNVMVEQTIQKDAPTLIQKSDVVKNGIIRAPVERLTSNKREGLLVSNGMPFAPGKLFSDKEIAFFDETGNEIPVATKILATWPQDNSIRSVLVQFNVDIPIKYKYVIIKWGTPRSVPDMQITEVNWEMPEAIVLLPPQWLCESFVTGEQAPMFQDRITGKPLTKYDQNIVERFSAQRDTAWTDDVATDNYYDTVHVFYQFYVRSGDSEYFKAARREAVHYRDKEILLDGQNRGKSKQHEQSRYVYVEAMSDDYLLTGDKRSLEVAGYMAEYLKNNFSPEKAFYPKRAAHHWTERDQAFPFLGIITYYELTGKQEYFETAKKYMANLYKTQNEWPGRGGFIHNLYSHDTEEGAGRDEYGGSPFMTGLLLEAIVKYHRITNSEVAKDSIFKALDWLMKEALAPDGEAFIYLTCRESKGEGQPDLNMLIVHAFGYGYKISGYKRSDYLELGKKLFKRGADSARLTDRKHFNQNYRSSGHFFAYINRLETVDQRP